MRRTDRKKAFQARATLKDSAALECEDCGLPLVFALETAAGEPFTMDLPTVIECLRTAERKGFLPPIGEEWWNDVCNHYNL